jgi:hypothetical protein
MRTYRMLSLTVLALASLITGFESSVVAQSLQERNQALLARLQQVHGLSEGQMRAIREIFSASGYLGEGNPAVTQHPLTPDG